MSFDSVPFGSLFSVPQKNGLTRPQKVRGTGLPMVNMGELFANSRIKNIDMDLVPVSGAESSFKLEGGDLLFARQSLVLSGAGQCSIFIDNHAPTVFESHIIRCRLNPEQADPRFYFYFFRSHAGRTAMETIIEQGAGASGIRGSDLVKLRVFAPKKKVQNAIADFLTAFDDRIDLLQETNLTLESIIKALFKSWFMGFDPVQAKAEGQEPKGLDAGTASLFPDQFEPSELGFIPKGWTVKPVGEVTQCVGGGTPDTKIPEYWSPAEFAWSTPRDLSGIEAPVLLKTDRSLSKKGLAKVSSGLLPAGTLLMSSRAPIGYLAIAQMPLAVNQGYIAMPPGSTLPPLYMLLWCQYNMETIKNRANGSTFMEISKKAFRPIPVVLPAPSVLDAFMAVAEPLFARIVENAKQAQTLAGLRDTLLPRLISGQLPLPEAEPLLRDAA